MTLAARRRQASNLSSTAPARSVRLFHWFSRYGRRYVAKHVHAVRISRAGYRPPHGLDGPTVVVVNHPSWWDPMIGLVLTDLWPENAKHYAPIDSEGLAKYPFLERLGFFGVEVHQTKGGLTFLRRSLAALAEPQAVLWVTAQGRFVDPRDRPTRIKGGVGHLASRLGSGHVLPLAIEYPFWEERTPEALVRFGAPLAIGPDEPDAWTERVAKALEMAQDALAEDAASRDATRFDTILDGGAGVGGIYDAWRRFKAIVLGRKFVAEHGMARDNVEHNVRA